MIIRDNIAAISRVVLIPALALCLFGCSKKGYNALLKNGTPDQMYTEAIRYFEIEKYSRTIQLLELIQYYYNSSNRADTVAYYLASAYYKSGDPETSAILLDDFRQTYTLSPFLEDVEYMYAKGFYLMSPNPQRDQSSTVRALMAIDEYLERYPNSPKKDALEENIDELYQKLHDKAFLNARSYYVTGHYKAAVVALKNALNRYPDSSHREEIMYLSVKSAYLLATDSVERLQRDRYLDMMDYYYNFVSEFPESIHIKELDKMQDDAKKFMTRYTDLTPEGTPSGS